MSNTLANLSVKQLTRAIQIKEKIEALEAELNQILGGHEKAASLPRGYKKRRRMSAAGRARIAEAQKARWAKIKCSTSAKGVDEKKKWPKASAVERAKRG